LEKNTGIAPTGIFKTTTQRELEKFLSQKINSLDQEFEQINEIIQKQKNVPESFINNSNPQLLVAQNSALEEQIIISKSEIDNLYKLVNLTVSITIIGFIISGGLLAWLFYKLNMIETSQNTGNSSNNHTELGSMENHIESKFTQIARYLENLDTRLKKLEISPQSPSGSKNIPINNQSLNPPVKTIINHPKSQQGNIYPSGISMSNKEIQIVTVYNNRPRSLSANAITVAENDRTVEQRRIGGSVAPILEENSLGNYWIVQEGNNEYLVPKANIKINEYNYETISSCFECLGYNPSYSSNFTLLKPATVSSIGQNWQLIELGKLQF
jgi:hypothetical protein